MGYHVQAMQWGHETSRDVVSRSLDRFVLVVRNHHIVELVVAFSPTHIHGPTSAWLWQYNIHT
jgi:hypothetical protein